MGRARSRVNAHAYRKDKGVNAHAYRKDKAGECAVREPAPAPCGC
jgi:hypothetical protein